MGEMLALFTEDMKKKGKNTFDQRIKNSNYEQLI